MDQLVPQPASADELVSAVEPSHPFCIRERVQQRSRCLAQKPGESRDELFADVVLQAAESTDEGVDLLGAFFVRGDLSYPLRVDVSGKERPGRLGEMGGLALGKVEGVSGLVGVLGQVGEAHKRTPVLRAIE